MFCRNCGKEIVDGSKFCAECGTKFDVENTSVENTVANIESNANTTENTSANSKTKKKYPTVLVICILIFSFIAIMVIVGLTSGPSIAEDSEYISAAKTAISTKLKAPSTAIYSNENIEDQDSYGRYSFV